MLCAAVTIKGAEILLRRLRVCMLLSLQGLILCSQSDPARPAPNKERAAMTHLCHEFVLSLTSKLTLVFVLIFHTIIEGDRAKKA